MRRGWRGGMGIGGNATVTVAVVAATLSGLVGLGLATTSDRDLPSATSAPDPAAGPGATSSPSAPVAPGMNDSPQPSPSASATARAPAAFTATALAAGERAPQFVVVSFDGGGNLEQWGRWIDVGRRTGADMSFFLSGTYLIPEDKRSLYRPPGKPVGSSEIGFSKTAADARLRLEFARQAYLDGDEIGTHYNGHFCGSSGVAAWSTADWRNEIAQFDAFLRDWRTYNDAPGAAALPFGPDDIVGGRTPCLEGKRSELFPALVARGFRYDTSGYGYLNWPEQRSDGLWDIPMQVLRMAGSGDYVLSMDYNFYERQSGAAPAPASRWDAMRQQVLDTYRNAYRAVSQGNRAPLILGAHFAPWNGGIYGDALADFVTETCDNPDTRCISFIQLVEWMEAQTPATLAKLQALPNQAMRY
ncbi:MAG: hypothetical protein ACT4P1_09770 [Sporichthyaceae bacterium]